MEGMGKIIFGKKINAMGGGRKWGRVVYFHKMAVVNNIY